VVLPVPVSGTDNTGKWYYQYRLLVLPVPVIGTAGINKGNILQNLLCVLCDFARDNFVGL
jgi:hypothetical protein